MDRGRRVRRVGASAGSIAAIAIAIGLLAKGLYPAELPESRNPHFIDSRGVVWAARLLLVSAAGVLAFGGVFIVLSVGTRMKNREWLRRAGPFEISEGRLSKAAEETEFWHKAALASQEEVVSLRKRLKRSKRLISELEEL